MKKLSRLKKIILFLNASSYRLALLGDSATEDTAFEKRKAFGVLLNYCMEFFLFKLLSINMNNISSFCFTFLLVTPLIFHSCIYLIFSSDLALVAKNYNYYYGKAYYIVYSILAILGGFYAVYYLFNQ